MKKYKFDYLENDVIELKFYSQTKNILRSNLLLLNFLYK